MAWPRNKKIDEMHEMYIAGYSLSKVAEFYGVSRQSVYELFKNNGKKTRELKKLDYVEFNGCKYTIRNTGYFAKTSGDRSLLHRDMWEFFNGKIPDGFDIHHLDENKLNNHIENFICIDKSDHTKLHNDLKKGKKCGS